MNQITTDWPCILRVKGVLYTLYTRHLLQGPTFGPCRSMTTRFRDTRLSKIETLRKKCTQWPQIDPEHLTLNSTMHTLCTFPRNPNFGGLRSRTSRLYFIIAHWLPWKIKEQETVSKRQTLKFHNSFDKFGRDHLKVHTWILVSEYWVCFYRRSRLKRSLPYGPMLTKKSNKIRK